MPAILRIFHYQTDASLSVLGHSGSYDQGGHGEDERGPAALHRGRLIGPIQAAGTITTSQTVTGCRISVGRCIAAGNGW